jgi:hypothetical protein
VVSVKKHLDSPLLRVYRPVSLNGPQSEQEADTEDTVKEEDTEDTEKCLAQRPQREPGHANSITPVIIVRSAVSWIA